MTSRDAVVAAVAHGAAMLGFVFFERSPRHLSIKRAADLAADVPPEVKKVAVVVDADDPLLEAVAAGLAPDLFQFHGDEHPGRVAAVAARFGVPVIKAIKVADASDIALGKDFRTSAEMLLFDAKAPKSAGALPGGNARAFDWHLLESVSPGENWMLSGGLDAGNVARAIEITGAPWVDVSSGVERAPGIKDAGKIAAFMRALKRNDSE